VLPQQLLVADFVRSLPELERYLVVLRPCSCYQQLDSYQSLAATTEAAQLVN